MEQPPPHIHMFRVEPNQKKKKKKNFLRVRQLSPSYERENSSRQQLREFRTRHRKSYTSHEQEQTYENMAKKDVNREQHRSPDKSYGTKGRQRSQPGAGHESNSRTTQDHGRCN